MADLSLKEQAIVEAIRELLTHQRGNETVEDVTAAVRLAENLRASLNGSSYYDVFCSDLIGALKTYLEDVRGRQAMKVKGVAK